MTDLKLRRLNELNSRDSGSECRSDRFLEAVRLEALRFFLLMLTTVHSAIQEMFQTLLLSADIFGF